MSASKKFAFGDNIYHQVNGGWWQINSHHSFDDGTPNQRNIENDTQKDRVLVASRFSYWGGEGPPIPPMFRSFNGNDICKKGQGHKRTFPTEMIIKFVNWFKSLNAQGVLGQPLDWKKTA